MKAIPCICLPRNAGTLDLKEMFKKLKLVNQIKDKWAKEQTLDGGWLTRVPCANEFEGFKSRKSAHVKHRANERMFDAFCQAWMKCNCMGLLWCWWAGRLMQSARNKKGYHSISQRHAVPCGQHLIGSNFIMQHYEDPKHTSELCKTYLGNKTGSQSILSLMD